MGGLERVIPVAGELLALLPFDGSAFHVLVMLPPAQSLVVVEYGGADGLFCSLLTYNVLVDTGLEVAWVELWNSEAWPVEHGPSALVKLARIIAAREAGIEVGRSSCDSGDCRSGQGTRCGTCCGTAEKEYRAGR